MLHLIHALGPVAALMIATSTHAEDGGGEDGRAQDIHDLSAGDVLGAAAIAPYRGVQPPPRLVVDPPLAEPLSRGQVFIQYRTENLRIVPVFGSTALNVTPRIGHIHVTVDDAPWHWADASGDPIVLVGFPPGPHHVEIILADANHQPLDRVVVDFVVPERPGAAGGPHAPAEPVRSQ